MQQKVDMETECDMTVPKDIIVCPKCKGALKDCEIEAQSYLSCAACKLAYPVRDGIPLLLQDEAVVH